ncbi:unnamed protein product [Prunus armeniaca]
MVVQTRMNTLNMSMNLMNTLNIDMNLLNMSETSGRESHDPLALASPLGSVGVAVASASEGVDIQVGVPLARWNTLIEVKLANLRIDYSVPPYVGLRLPTAADVVPMMLAKLGYAPEQYNPNFWILLHGVYIAWWLVGLGEPTFEQFMYLYSILKQHWSFGWVQDNCRKAKEKGYFIGHKPSTQKSWRNRWCLAYGDWECSPGKTVTKHIPTHFQFIGSLKWELISKEQEDEVESRPDNIAHNCLHTTRIRKKLSIFGLSLLGRVENG